MDSRTKFDNKEQCKDALKFLDYLRKSQCVQNKHYIETTEGKRTKYTYSEKRHSHDHNNVECDNVLKQMEKTARECAQTFVYKR